MSENLTEQGLISKEKEYESRYSKAVQEFYSSRYFADLEFNINDNPIYYIKIISIEKDAAANPAAVIREQIQKALMALWSVGRRFSMIIDHRGSATEIYVGTVCERKITKPLSDLKDIFAGSVCGIEFERDAAANDLNCYKFEHFQKLYGDNPIGFFVGNPIVCDLSDSEKNVSPLDEVISGSEGRDWILCITAKPVDKSDTINDRTGWYYALAESSRFTNVSFNYGVVGNNRSMNVEEQYPGTRLYHEFAQKYCSEFDEAVQCGQWLVGAFCSSTDVNSMNIFGGMFSAHMKNGTEQIQRPFPFEYSTRSAMTFNASLQIPAELSMTPLTTRELSVLCALPVRDTCGFNVAERVEFDIYRKTGGNLCLGKIVNGRNVTSADYTIDLDSLNRHGLIVGLTGGGKTNTVKSLLHSFQKLNCPFMVIEPAKKEYYEIYNMGMKDLKIYSVGSSEGTPLYINPFEIACANGRRVSLQSHIDAVFAAFKASFIMYTPMPYVLENAIYAIYRDYGWDPETDTNRFGRTDYPTIEDLYYKIGPVVREMGYDAKMQNDLIGSLKARINSLRVGAKGRTLNVAGSVSMERLLQGKTIIELDDVNDEDAKAFIISLLLLQIQECRKVQPTAQRKVRHILLIEEAHRLLKNVSSGTGENADPRGNAVEFFCNMLAELRSKGQGFLVIDQSPSKLAPDLIKNTNLKLIHRTVAGDDRHLVGSAMNMTDEQERYLACLRQGFAAVYSEGDNHPKVVNLPLADVYNTSMLGRAEILSATAQIPENRLDFVNQSSINPICRHCRLCQHRQSPESKLAENPSALQAARSTYKLQSHEAINYVKLTFKNDNQLRRCILAAWFKANEAAATCYDDCARTLDHMIKMLFLQS